MSLDLQERVNPSVAPEVANILYDFTAELINANLPNNLINLIPVFKPSHFLISFRIPFYLSFPSIEKHTNSILLGIQRNMLDVSAPISAQIPADRLELMNRYKMQECKVMATVLFYIYFQIHMEPKIAMALLQLYQRLTDAYKNNTTDDDLFEVIFLFYPKRSPVYWYAITYPLSGCFQDYDDNNGGFARSSNQRIDRYKITFERQ